MASSKEYLEIIHITLDTYADIYGSLNSASLDTLEKYLEV